MKDWKHLNLEQRKAISNGISHKYKLKDLFLFIYNLTEISLIN